MTHLCLSFSFLSGSGRLIKSLFGQGDYLIDYSNPLTNTKHLTIQTLYEKLEDKVHYIRSGLFARSKIGYEIKLKHKEENNLGLISL